MFMLTADADASALPRCDVEQYLLDKPPHPATDAMFYLSMPSVQSGELCEVASTRGSILGADRAWLLDLSHFMSAAASATY